jgi:glycosyltransferase involved in cell wall biosynthesis
MVDIIIPAYKAQNTIYLTLSSILTQTFVDKVKVTIVNDCINEDDNYDEEIKYFGKYFPIQEIKCKENIGPGFARQLGVDRTREQYVTFIDADDVFSDSLSIQKMVELLDQNKNAAMCSCSFLEEFSTSTFLRHDNDIVWMFGKMYRRSFIKENNIKFVTSRSNEDLGFNLQIKIRLKGEQYIHFFHDIVYLWKWKEDSITRINNANYSFYEGTLGVIDTKLNILKNEDIEKENIKIEVVSGLVDFYFMIQTTKMYRPDNPEYYDEIYGKILEYYKEIGKSCLDSLPQQTVVQIFTDRQKLTSIIPIFTLLDFIDGLNKEA